MFVRLNTSKECSDVVNLFRELLLQGKAFLNAEVNNGLERLFDGLADYAPFLFGEHFHLSLSQYVRHAHQTEEPIFRFGNSKFCHQVLHLCVVVAYQSLIDRCGIHTFFFFNPDAEVHLSANQGLSHHLAHLHFLLAVEWGDTGIEV